MRTPDLDDVAIVVMLIAAIAAVVLHERSLRKGPRRPPEER